MLQNYLRKDLADVLWNNNFLSYHYYFLNTNTYGKILVRKKINLTKFMGYVSDILFIPNEHERFLQLRPRLNEKIEHMPQYIPSLL